MTRHILGPALATMFAAGVLSLCAVPAPAQEAMRTPELQAELDQLAADFNVLYCSRTPVSMLLDGQRKQRQVFFGLYEKNRDGDWVQKNICETLNNTGFAPEGAAEGVQRLTIEDGKIIVRVTYQYKGGPLRPCPPAAVKRVGNGIVFHDIDGNGGGWLSNEFYFTPAGRHDSLRRFQGGFNDDAEDLFVEEDVKQAEALTQTQPSS